MDQLSIERAIMWPTLASLLEERLADDPRATHTVLYALNRWMLEEWTYDFKDRIYPTPVIAMNIVDEAIRELDFVVDHGAKVILIRPAPVPDLTGRRRSFALPEFEPFWDKVHPAGLLVGVHASDDGQQRYENELTGHSGDEFLPFEQQATAFEVLLRADHRGISDVVTSIIGHGLANRLPDIRFMPVENGSAWVRPLVGRMQKVYDRMPKLFEEDPLVTPKRSIAIHPFREEDPIGLIELVGVDNVVFGSDYPHPGGLFDPVTWVDELESLSEADQAKVMGGNLARLVRRADRQRLVRLYGTRSATARRPGRGALPRLPDRRRRAGLRLRRQARHVAASALQLAAPPAGVFGVHGTAGPTAARMS
jgi:predicted TIM-barrel fold metal-dependent hydrolase